MNLWIDGRQVEAVPGERLLDFARREDLECLLRLYAPAHTVLIIGYEE